MKFSLLACVFGTVLLASVSASDTKFVDEVRQNFEESINGELASQVNRELTASYVYQAYASFFGRADVALPGFQKFFSEASKEERDHAQKLIDYINMRGGHAKMDDIDLSKGCDAMADAGILTAPRTRACICEFSWTKSNNECGREAEGQYGLQAMEDALSLERFVNKKLLDLHKKADAAGDAHLTHILEHEFLEEQVHSIRELAGYVTRLRSFKTNYALGEYMFDQKLYGRLLVLCALCACTMAFTKDYVAEVRQNFAEKSNSELNNQMAAFHRASLVYMAYASYFDRSSVNLPGFRKFFLAASQASLKDAHKVTDYINLRGGHQQFPRLDISAACKAMKVPKSLEDSLPDDYSPQICHFVLKTDPSASLKKKKKNKQSYSFASLFASKQARQDDEQSSDEDWQHGLMALTDALLLERSLNRQLLDMVKGAAGRKDTHLRHTVEDSFLTQQTERIKKLADVITKLRRYTEQEYPLGEYVIDLEMGN
ncbi:uncharacterized protein LOC143296427 [Babylonia areolata]|uniref:uncharacterized protein LOC143296427 n=1 Tax=Babylonia areolata TaxID=304850 RepID=UPI003FD1CDA4